MFFGLLSGYCWSQTVRKSIILSGFNQVFTFAWFFNRSPDDTTAGNGTRTGYRLFTEQKTAGQHLVYLVWTMLNGHGTVLQLIIYN